MAWRHYKANDVKIVRETCWKKTDKRTSQVRNSGVVPSSSTDDKDKDDLIFSPNDQDDKNQKQMH
eukprot:1514321-Ditylum_brightwellii.AAC.1